MYNYGKLYQLHIRVRNNANKREMCVDHNLKQTYSNCLYMSHLAVSR